MRLNMFAPSSPVACQGECPEGNPCICRTANDGKRLNHTLCICKDPHCKCHSKERYESKDVRTKAV